MSRPTPAAVHCTKCGKEIEICEGCQRPDCASAVCYGCMNRLLGQTLPQPHAHGG